MLILEDYGGRRRHFRLEGPASDWSVERTAAKWPTSGFATFAWQVLWFRSSTIVGVFAERQTLWLRVGSRLFDLKAADVELHDEWTRGLLRRFSVTVGGTVMASVVYLQWATDHDGGIDGVGTIFDFLMTFRDDTQVDRTVFVWSSAVDGRDVESEEFEHELATRFPRYDS